MVKLDSDRAPQWSQRFHVTGLPTVVLFRGGTEAGRIVGMDPQGIRGMADAAAS